MATAEFEELKLSVVLIDDASSGLTALRGEMRRFNDDSTRFIKNARDNAEAMRRVARETDEVVKGLRAKGAMLMRVGNAVGVMTAAYYGTVTWLAKFALEVEQVANAAQLLGVSYADLRNISEQMARKGLSPEMGGRILGAVNNLALQLESMKGIQELGHKLQHGGRLQYKPEQLEAHFEALKKAKDWHERLQILQQGAAELERKGLEARRTKTEVAADLEEYWVSRGFPKEMALMDDITATTLAQRAKYGKIEEDAKKWTEVTHKIIKSMNTILAILNADSMDPDGPFFAMLKLGVNISGYVADNIGNWIKHIQDAATWFAQTFAGSPEGKGQEKPAEGLGDFMLPPAEPMGGDALKLEKLIKEFRAFEQNLRGGGGVPAAPLEQHASLGSMATPGLQLPPAAAAGDVYTDEYGIWPGGGSKPTGSDVGPGSGIGAGGGTGVGASPMRGFGDSNFGQGPVEGSFRRGVPRLRTPGGIPLGRRWGPGAADGNDLPGGRMPEPIPGDFRMPGGSGRRESYKNVVAQPDYLAGTEPSTNIQDVRGGSWGGPGGAGGTSQPPHLMPPGYSSREKSVFVPGLDLPAPQYPPSTTNPMEMSIEDLASQPFYLKRERQQFEPGSMRDLLQKNPNLYRRDAEYTQRQIELRQEREAAELNEPLAFPWRAPGGPRTGPGDLGPSGIPTDRGQFGLDRSVLDRGMGNEMGGKLEGGAKLSVDYNGPRAEVTAESSGILNSSEVNRQMPME